jgi:ABC-2 type transport system ATP-binding protein
MQVIEVKNLRKQYRDVVAVDDVSFTVEHGEIFGIAGPNGAGKTTTVECLEGLRKPDGGTVGVLGLDPSHDREKLAVRIGVQLQESNLPERMKVAEALDLYSSFYPDPLDWRTLIDEWGLAEKRNSYFGKLSGGQKQRLFIALALVGNPEIAFLDELTTGLDPQARRETWHLIEEIRNKGVTVILVTHFMEEAERLCDRLALIDHGRVIAIDSPSGLVSRVDATKRVRFEPSVPVDLNLFMSLPEVTNVERNGPQIVVTGTGNLIQPVAAVLAKNQIVANNLRVDQTSLDDAFIALTGRQPEAATPS